MKNVFGKELIGFECITVSRDLIYSRSIRSVNKGTMGRSQRAALMSARRLPLTRAKRHSYAQLGAHKRRRAARGLTAHGAHYAIPATCPTSSHGARRTNPTRYADRPRCTFTARMQSTHIFASRSDKRIDDESGS
ncbi:unnamed protein product [Pieris macdunnoughi]|uniref:Uncharacterized protein n=1 Tax=Pieris macdunnoughi TaxID=345717 RepID=A0A821N709_9NEOP|nr:unnamed protein product [Pieris macdunnoughi]